VRSIVPIRLRLRLRLKVWLWRKRNPILAAYADHINFDIERQFFNGTPGTPLPPPTAPHVYVRKPF